ncbi:hypothetical protein [Brevundimonas sp.]|uniref:hypothetical protein n=1 Tax=Brevundimonas sp. TaxID=1871086 RepID=UPI002D32CFAB|nr:hypothetical protein [Brevundimonas sp.]HYC68227.1 hypothetical protein [Brevundimonas sp.]
MFGPVLLVFASAAAFSGSPAAQDPTSPPPPIHVPAAVQPAGQVFPPGAEVLSVEGEPLGVLTRVETRPAGERILHIRRPDGSMTAAPASVASRGERAVVLDWTRSEFEASAATPTAESASAAPAPPLS